MIEIVGLYADDTLWDEARQFAQSDLAIRAAGASFGGSFDEAVGA